MHPIKRHWRAGTHAFKRRWYVIPVSIRKPIVLLVGMAIVIISPFTGALPGPGGIPVFLLGIAILSTEFEWAKRLRDWTIDRIHWLGRLWRAHKIVGTVVCIVSIAAVVSLSYYTFGVIRDLRQ